MSDVDPYSVPCPDCGQAATEPCLYLPLPHVDPDFVHYRSAKVQARAALTGTPTKRPHNGRIGVVHQREVRRALGARRRELLSQGRVAEASSTRRVIARIEQEFDRQEYEALRAWLARNARILTDAGR